MKTRIIDEIIRVEGGYVDDPSTPTAGGRMFVQGGALKYIGSGGTITTIAPA